MKRLIAVILLAVAIAVTAQAAVHSTSLSWTLSTDDDATLATPVNCVASAGCVQNVYRAQGACSATSSFTLLTTTALAPTVTTFSDTSLHPGTWCYGVTFSMNGLESAKDTVTVSLPPASVTGVTATAQ